MQGGLRLVIDHSRALGARLGLGASLAVSGVCLTVVAGDAESSELELSPETLRRTTLGAKRAGDAVNLEAALAMGDPLGGHWVQGHVDGTLEVLERRDLDAHRELAISLPEEHAASVVEKGSVCLDGVSLTVSALRPDCFEVALIPHTLAVTTLADLAVGDRVHFEADILGKYVARALALYAASAAHGPRTRDR